MKKWKLQPGELTAELLSAAKRWNDPRLIEIGAWCLTKDIEDLEKENDRRV